MICPAADQSGMAITSPASDTIVDTTPVKVTGSVMSISQIDVSLDDVYNSTIAIAAGESQFETLVSLEPGTHTIKLLAYDSCAQQTHEDSFVISYSPVFVPAAGRDAETTVAAGTLFSAPPASPAAAVSAEESGGEIAALPEFVQKIFRGLGWTATDDGNSNRMDIGRSIAVIIAILVLLIATILSIARSSGLLAKGWPHGRRLKFIRQGIQYVIHRIRIVWAVGIILLILPFLV